MEQQISSVDELVAHLQLLPHPEGGYFRETYRGGYDIVRSRDGMTRSVSTAIYYLLRSGDKSTWHRIESDEMWHFYEGIPLHIYVLQPDGELEILHLGNPLTHEGAAFQALVPAGAWFAAECAEPGGYTLAGCTVAPGFEFNEFEIADKNTLLSAWPQHAQVIERLS